MKIKFTLLLILISSVSHAQMTHQDSLNSVVNEYFRLNVKVFQSGSSQSDIDSLFSLFSEDFTYLHPNYGGTYSRKDLYDGYINNQKNGRYNGRVADIKVTNRISGLNAVSVEKRFVTRKDDTLSEGEPQMTLFEFRDGKIYRIHEFW
ncbi:nuclear transport factor 2 family protein [Ekhidna sp. MALMAid0563]|uniref:nuclear transport factor 2 family protein n=1 Tax=Ekhidna sp. MALMAid0563 TaxID=3143937 RepID=UPI0032DE4037